MDRRRRGEEKPKETKLASMEDRIYSTDNPVSFRDARSVLHENVGSVQKDWQEIEEEQVDEEIIKRNEERQASFFKRFSHRFFAVAVVLLVLAGSYGGYQIYSGGKTILNNKIGFSVETPSFIDGGVEFPVDIYITNGNKATMERVDVVIEYPKGETITSVEDTAIKRVPLGNIAAGETKKGLTEMVLFGREGNIRNIKAYVEFYSPGSSVVRKKDITKTISLRSAPVVITTEHLKEISSNEEVGYTVRVKAERGVDLSNFLVKVEYPNGFQYTRSSVEPRFGNNIWAFDEIPKGTEKIFTIYGKIRGEDGDERVFRVTGGSENMWNKGEIGIVYADTKSSLVIQKPFIGITGEFDAPMLSTGEFAIPSAKRSQGTITLRNNVQDTISNIIVNTTISGEVLNRQKVIVNGGFFNSAKNLIVWDQSTDPRLKKMLPGDVITLDFAIESYPLSSKSGGLFIDPSIKLEVEARGRRLSETQVPEVYSSGSPLIARVITEAGIKTSAMYSSGPIKNSGPFPVQPEQKTTLTVLFEAQNRSNPVENAVVTIPLPPYVSYEGVISPENKNVTYDANSRTIRWVIGTIPTGTGYGRGEEKVYINVAVTPSVQQSQNNLPIMGQHVFTGKDQFTQTELSITGQQTTIDYKVQ